MYVRDGGEWKGKDEKDPLESYKRRNARGEVRKGYVEIVMSSTVFTVKIHVLITL